MVINEYIAKPIIVTFEYIMLDHGMTLWNRRKQLADLLADKKRLSYVNLIPYNKVREHDQYERGKERVVASL